jgi:hypothetical protein
VYGSGGFHQVPGVSGYPNAGSNAGRPR